MLLVQRTTLAGILLCSFLQGCTAEDPATESKAASGSGGQIDESPGGGAAGTQEDEQGGGGWGGDVEDDDSPEPEHRDASFCPAEDFTSHCEDPGYYVFERHVGCGLARHVTLDDSFTMEFIYTDTATDEVVYRAVRPDVGGGCDVYVDETEGVPTCDEWVLEPCDP